MAKQLNVALNFTANTAEAKARIGELNTQLNNLNASLTRPDLPITKEVNEAITATSKLKVALQQSMNVDTGKFDLSKFNQTLKKSGTSLSQLHSQLSAVGPDGRRAFLSLAQSIAAAEIPSKRMNSQLNEMWNTLKNSARWQISSSVLHSLQGAIQSAFNYAEDLNKSLTNIRIVTGQSTDQMAKFAEKANQAAKALSTTTTKYTDAALIYYQQGLSDEEVQKRTDATIKMANVTGENAENVSSYMTAIWNNFDDGSKPLEYYADVITKLGAETAASSEEIANGLEKFAAIGDTIGLSYEYATAALTTIIDKTRQSEDVVGTALKTIFARIQGLKVGETTEEGLDLNKYSKALNAYGIQIFDANNNLKDMDTILDDMGEKWQTLSRADKTALAQTVAGVRQYNQLISLMDNWDSMKENIISARNSEGTLQEQADIYAESWQAASNRVRAAIEEIFSDLINDDFFIDLLNDLEKILNFVDLLIDSAGGLKGVLLAISSIILKTFNQQIATGIQNMAYNFKSFTGMNKGEIEGIKQEATNLASQQPSNDIIDNVEQASLYVSEQRLNIQSALNARGSELSQLQKEILRQENSINAAIGEEYKKSVQNKEVAQEELKILRQKYNMSAKNGLRSKQDDKNLVNRYIENIKNNKTEEFATNDLFAEVTNNLKLNKKEAQEYTTALIRMAESEMNAAQAKENFNESTLRTIDRVEQEANSLQNLDYSTIFVNAAQSISSLSMGLVSLKSAWDTVQDPDLSGWEKFTSISMSLGMGIPMLMSGLSGLSKLFGPIISSISALNAVLDINTISTISNYIAQKNLSNKEKEELILKLLINKGIEEHTARTLVDTIAQQGLTRALIKQLAAQLGVNAAMLITIGKIALIVAAIATVIAIIDALTISQKEANENINEATEAYEEEKQKLDELKNSLKEVNQKIDELNGKDVLSITDENDLIRLKQEKKLLEQQIAIQEKLTEQAQKNQAKEIERNLPSSLKWVDSKPKDSKVKKGGKTYELKASQDQIDSWVAENADNISDAEQRFADYMLAVNSGLVELNQNVVNEISEMRHSIYGDDEYYEMFIKPTLLDEDYKDKFKDIALVFKDGGELSAAQQEWFDKVAANAGITSEELEKSLTESMDRISQAISGEIGFNDLKADDLELMLSLGFVDDESKSNIEKILALKEDGTIPLNVSTKYDFDSDSEIDDYLKNNTNIERSDLDTMTELSLNKDNQAGLNEFWETTKAQDENNVAEKQRIKNSVELNKDSTQEERQKADEDYNKALQEQKDNLENNAIAEERYTKLLQRSAAATARQSKGIEDLNKNFETNSKILKNKALKGTAEYAEALNDTRNSLADLLNVDATDLSAEFLESEENLNLLKKSIEGSDEAFEQLREKATQDIIAHLDIQENSEFAAQDVKNTLNDLLNYLDTADFGIDGYVDLNDQAFYDKINKMLADGVITADQLTKTLSSAGYVGEISEKEIKPKPAHIIYDITGNFGDQAYDGSIELTEKVDQPITVPVLKGAYQNNSGISHVVSANKAKSSSSGGSKSKVDKVDKTKKSDIVDRYKEINDTLDDQSKKLDQLNKKHDRLYGKDRLKSIDKITKALKEENKALVQKKKEAKEYLKEDKKQMQSDLKAAQKKAGLKNTKFKFDKDGDISNYENIMNALYKKLRKKENEYNKKYAGKTESDASKAAKEKLDELKDKIDNVKTAISQYDETKGLVEEISEEIKDNLNEIQDNNYEKLSYEIELRVTVNENDKRELEYYFNKLDTDIYKSAEALSYLYNKDGDNLVNNAKQALEDNSKAIEELNRQRKLALDNPKDGSGISQADYIAGLQEQLDSLYDNLEALQDLDNQMMEYYGNTLNKASEELSKYTNQMDHLISVLEHYQKVLELTGKGQDYEAMDKVLQGQSKTLKNNFDVSKANYEMLEKEKKSIEEKISKMDQTSAAYELEKKKLEDITTATNEAYEEMLGDAESYLEALQRIWENSLENIKKKTSDTLTGGLGFDILLDSMSNLKTYQDEYLTNTNKLFETNKLLSQIQMDIDKTSNAAAKQRYKAFSKEIEQLQKKDELSNLELEIAQAKYKQLQAQMALEEAQNAKSTVRLSRDNEGNYGYVYTADQNAVNDAQDALAQAENDLYNIRLNATNDYGEKMVQAQKEYIEKLAEIDKEYADDDVKRTEARKKAKEEYYNIINTYSKLYSIAQQEDLRVQEDAWINYYDDIINKGDAWKTILNDYTDQTEEKFKEWQTETEKVTKAIGLDMGTLSDKVKSVTDQSDALAKTATEKVIPAMSDEIKKVDELTTAYGAQRDAIKKLIEEKEKLAKDTKNTIAEESGEEIDENEWNKRLQAGGKYENAKYQSTDKYGNIHYSNISQNSLNNLINKSNSLSEKANEVNQKRSKIVNERRAAGEKVYTDVDKYGILHYAATKDTLKDLIKEANAKNAPSFDTGGYTGKWGPEGKLAILHEKELVLNQEDTNNLLKIIEIVRNAIDGNVASAGFGSLRAAGISTNNETLEQNVTITAEFPNATDHNEIEQAFDSLINRAAQFANRKK